MVVHSRGNASGLPPGSRPRPAALGQQVPGTLQAQTPRAAQVIARSAVLAHPIGIHTGLDRTSTGVHSLRESSRLQARFVAPTGGAVLQAMETTRHKRSPSNPELKRSSSSDKFSCHGVAQGHYLITAKTTYDAIGTDSLGPCFVLLAYSSSQVFFAHVHACETSVAEVLVSMVEGISPTNVIVVRGMSESIKTDDAIELIQKKFGVSSRPSQRALRVSWYSRPARAQSNDLTRSKQIICSNTFPRRRAEAS